MKLWWLNSLVRMISCGSTSTVSSPGRWEGLRSEHAELGKVKSSNVRRKIPLHILVDKVCTRREKHISYMHCTCFKQMSCILLKQTARSIFVGPFHHAKKNLRSLSFSYQKKAGLAPAKWSLHLVWHWLWNIIYEDNRVQFNSQCHTREGLAGASPFSMGTTKIIIVESSIYVRVVLHHAWTSKQDHLPVPLPGPCWTPQPRALEPDGSGCKGHSKRIHFVYFSAFVP